MKKHQTVKTATLAYLMEPSLPIVAPVNKANIHEVVVVL
jgi:hypothetical protein